MTNYAFHLGHQPYISIAEIRAVLEAHEWSYKIMSASDEMLIISSEELSDIDALQNQLGGTTKIAEQLHLDGDIESGVVHYLGTLIPEGKIQFSLSGKQAKQRALTVKKMLRDLGRSVRYVEPKNSATTLYNGLVERKTDLALYHGAAWVTRTIQPFWSFKERDYDRPASDDKSGMLPPKLARILINLGMRKPEETVLFDPFCGSGTLLLEGLSLGCAAVYGSDISAKAVSDSESNIQWFKEKEGGKSEVIVEQHDMTQSISFLPQQVTLVATEPYMGKPLSGKESEDVLHAQAQELAELYDTAFKHLALIMDEGSTVIFVIPQFKCHDKWILIDCLDAIKKHGFSIVPFSKGHPSLLYHRPTQHLGRSIWKFKKTS